MHEGGGNCLKYVKGGWNRTERRGHKDFKKGGKLGQGMGALKKGGGLESPYELCYPNAHIQTFRNRWSFN